LGRTNADVIGSLLAPPKPLKQNASERKKKRRLF